MNTIRKKINKSLKLKSLPFESTLFWVRVSAEVMEKPEKMWEIFWGWSQQDMQVASLRRKSKNTVQFQSWVAKE